MLIEKIKLLYSSGPMNLSTQEDAKYERIMTSFDRLKKSLTHQHESLIEIDIKVGNLIKRRLEREQAGPEYFRLLQFAKKARELQEEFNKNQERDKSKSPNKKTDKKALENITDVKELVQESIREEDAQIMPLTQLAGKPRKDEKFRPFISPFLKQKEQKKRKRNKYARAEESEDS